MIPDLFPILISMHACPFPDCNYKTLQKSNVQTHIRTHTRERSNMCPHPGCTFTTTDPASLTRHRKHLHSYEPKARRNLGGKTARRSAAAPYPSTQFMRPEEDVPVTLDLNDLTFSELTWEKLFPDFPAESFASVYEQPSQLPTTSNHLQPSTVPVNLSTLHMPQFDPKLFSDINYQQPIPAFDADFQYQPVTGNHLNNSLPAELEEFLQTYGSGYFEGRYEYPDLATHSMSQPSFTNEYTVY